jgi:hypothetical protein
LLSVDATDRDHPLVRGNLTLAWPVDRLFLAGEYLIELGDSGGWTWWDNRSSPVLRVAMANSPNRILTQLSLTNLPVIGATQRGARLYLAQGGQDWFYPVPIPLVDANGGSAIPAGSRLLLTVVGLEDLPAVQILGQVEMATDLVGGTDLQAVWPDRDLLVWVGGGFRFWWWDFRLVPGLARPAQVVATVLGRRRGTFGCV